MSRPALSLGCLLADVHLAVVKLDLATRLALDGIARHVIIPPAITVPQATRVVGRHCIVRAATIRGDRCGSWLRENADEPRIRRIVFSIGFSRKRPPVQLFFTSTKSRQSFYAQVQLQSYHAARVGSRHSKPPWLPEQYHCSKGYLRSNLHPCSKARWRR